MSYYDDASLVVIPSGYKTSKVYAEKPTDGSGDLAFTRTGDTATRVNSAGLIEKVRTNLLTYSQDFSNAAWNKLNVTLTSGQTDPNGGSTASTVDPTNTTSAYVRQSISITSGIKYTWSVYIKGSTTGQSIALYTDGASNIYEVKALTTSWQRFTGVATAASSGSSGFYVLCGSGYSGLTDLPFDIAFAQVEASDVATAYIPTTTAAVSVGPVANVPRLDYLGSTCPRLLLEPQRTNTLTYSEAFDNSAWTKLNSTISANTTDTLDPSGYNGADKITDNTTNAAHLVFRLSTWDTTQRTASVYAKAGTSSKITIQNASTGQGAFFDLSTGTISALSAPFTATITAVGNGWYRITATHTAASSQTFAIGFFTGSATTNYAGTGSYAYLWGAQLEQGYATSYIPTLAASATRGADACSKTGISSLIGQTEGTLFVDAVLTHNTVSNEYLIQVRANNDNRFFIYREGGTNKLACFARVGAATTYTQLTAAAVTGTVKAAFAYKSGSFAFYVNGVQVGTSAATYTLAATLSEFFIDQNNGLEFAYDTYNQALLFKTRLTNAELATLTTL